ncbi:hypothetical protein Tco_1111190, partial [Tanacetum coccineum]
MSHPWDLSDGKALLRDVNMEKSASQPSVVHTTNIGFSTCDGKSIYVLPTEGNGDAIVFNIVPNVLNIAEIFGVPFKTFADIEDLMNGIEMGNHEAVWSIMTEDRFSKSTSYAGVAGASAKDQPKVNFNFCPLVADPVFDGVNISILCKVVEKEQLGETWAKKDYDEYQRLLFFKFDSRAVLEA